MIRSIPLLLCGLLLAGCLPGQQRTTPRELFPADSLSRQIAEAAQVDTLEVVWRAEAPNQVRFPLTLNWSGSGIFVADAQQGALHRFDEEGNHQAGFEDGALQYPFIAGVQGDTVVVLSRGREHLALVNMGPGAEPALVGTVPIPAGRNPVAAVHADGFVVKVADQNDGSRLIDLDRSGRERATYPLSEPFWRHIGFVRVWNETVLSLSGYRPVVGVLPLGAPPLTPVDTLALRGFDSPQMARSRQFVMGDIREPPLLVPSAVPVGDRLFVLNARAGWVHVDVFTHAGDYLMLERTLLSPRPDLGRNFFAADLAVKRVGNGYDIVILENRPQPALVRYRWLPGGNGTAL